MAMQIGTPTWRAHPECLNRLGFAAPGDVERVNHGPSRSCRPWDEAGPAERLAIDELRIRILGDIAIIHARTSYRTADGTQRNGRYTDVWAKRGGKWLAVSAHVTR